jgi:AcrR family transcriptional regulator
MSRNFLPKVPIFREMCKDEGVSETTTTSQRRSRGRPRLFDEEAALDQLTTLFWEKGFSQTSMADLVEASGVHKSSLYSTFGSKDELFATILRRYYKDRMAMFASVIETAGDGFDAIHTFLDMMLEDVVSGPGQHGCLLVNTSVELNGSAPGFENFAVTYRAAIRDILRQLVAQAEPAGCTDGQLTDQRTDLLQTFMLGLISATRGGADELELRRLMDSMHATVDTWRN